MFLSLVCTVMHMFEQAVSSSSWGLGRAAVCNCDTPWTFLLPFLLDTELVFLM